MRSKKFLFYLLILTLFLTFNLLSCGGDDDGFIVVPEKSELKVFVTSASGTGDLTSWTAYTASGSSATGLEAGDAICQYLAKEAGLSGTFRAWLSDTDTDAYCHLHGRTGKKADNCGGTSLPKPYGPWVRMDGFPFGETIDIITSDTGQIYAPVQFDEKGNTLINRHYFTDTDDTGARPAYSSGSCSNWSSQIGSGNSATTGRSTHTTKGWTDSGGVGCDGVWRLLCMQIGRGPALPSHISAGKKAFITSRGGSGNLSTWTGATGSGIAAGDAICQSLATAAGLANADKFKAWLSDSSTDAIDRFAYNGPWVRIDGVKIADNKSDLTDGLLFSPINQTEEGHYRTNYGVWTGTEKNGGKSANNCNNWTSDDSSGSLKGLRGVAYTADSYWTEAISNNCNTMQWLYCFEDE